jgi:hypothetical protein
MGSSLGKPSISTLNTESITSPKGPFHCAESMIKKISPVNPVAGGRLSFDSEHELRSETKMTESNRKYFMDEGISFYELKLS